LETFADLWNPNEDFQTGNTGNACFRRSPALRLEARDLERIHGFGERIAIRTYVEAIRAYRQHPSRQKEEASRCQKV